MAVSNTVISNALYANATSRMGGKPAAYTDAQWNVLLVGVRAWCDDMAAVIADAIRSASVNVTVSAGGLQRTPNPNNAATATDAPASPVTLTGTLT